jgi:hypothetical protein
MADLDGDRARLRVGIDIIPDESLVSFVFRLAKRLGSLAPSTIRTRFGRSTMWPTRPTADALARLAEFADVDTAALSALTFGPPDADKGSYRGRSLPSRMFRLSGSYANRFVCPECLTESPHHRAIWDFAAISACPVHRVELTAACDACGDSLGWHGNNLAKCRCGRQLSEIRAQRVTDDALAGTEAFYGLLDDVRFSEEAARVRRMPPFSDLGDAEILDFLYRFGAETLGRRKKIFSHEGTHDIAVEGHLALTGGLAALDPWPDAFDVALAGFCARGPFPIGQAVKKWLGPMYRWLDALPTGHGVEIEDALDEFRRQRGLSGILAKRTKGPRPRP